VNCGGEGAIPARCVHPDGLKAPRSPPGSRSSRGGLPRRSARRKACCTAERVDLNDPPITRTTCSDVVRVRCGDHEVSGRRRAGAQSGHAIVSTKRAPASSTRLLPTVTRDAFARGQTARRSYSFAGHRCSGDAFLPNVKGLFAVAAMRQRGRKHAKGKRDWAPKPGSRARTRDCLGAT